jgi:hypothetical protein
MMEALASSETSVLTIATRNNIPEYGILHKHRHDNQKTYIVLTYWALLRTRNVSPVRYEMGFYIPEDNVLQSTPSKPQILHSTNRLGSVAKT